MTIPIEAVVLLTVIYLSTAIKILNRYKLDSIAAQVSADNGRSSYREQSNRISSFTYPFGFNQAIF